MQQSDVTQAVIEACGAEGTRLLRELLGAQCLTSRSAGLADVSTPPSILRVADSA